MTGGDILIKNARIIDPSNKTDRPGDILIKDGIISRIDVSIEAPAVKTIDASGLVACPGFIDLHCHLREPGYEEKETIASGTSAAARGGFTTVCCMPNTNPPLDNAATIGYIYQTAARESKITVIPAGCITAGRKGQGLSEMTEMANAGCMGFSDDGNPVVSSRIMQLAMLNARGLGLPIIDHCEDIDLSHDGQMNDGWISARLGLKGIPCAAEESIVARDIALAAETGAKLHVTHISTRGSVDLVRAARAKGQQVTADVTPHHLSLTEEFVAQMPSCQDVLLYDTNAKVNPPLRTRDDLDALIEGIIDGTIDAIATDHAPHTSEDKLCEFENAAFGISGFETAFGLLMTLVHSGRISLSVLLSCLTCGPAGILHRRFGKTGSLATLSSADIVLFDPEMEWTVDTAKMFSRGKNSPLAGWKLRGLIMATIHGGETPYLDSKVRLTL